MIAAHIARLRAAVGHDLLLLPAVSVLAVDGGQVLLVRQADDPEHWNVPGGAVDPGESPAAAAIREAREELGADVELTRLVAAIGGPSCVVDYPNGDRTAYVVVLYEARITGILLTAADGEVTGMSWFSPKDLPGLPVSPMARALLDAWQAGT